ncbi:MAG: hypothetical protein K6F69_10445 [Treponema sp.]|nr:hypothetical protein [Treponema sp.]
MEADLSENVDADLLKDFSNFENLMYKSFTDYISDGFLKSLAYCLLYLPKEKREKELTVLNEKYGEKFTDKLVEIISAEEKKSVNCLDKNVLSETAHALRFQEFNEFEKIRNLLMSNNKSYDISYYLKAIYNVNPIFSMIINKLSCVFEDIVFLDDRAVQKVLREIDAQELAKALKGMDPVVCDKIFRNMSHRASSMLQEDIEYMGPIPKQSVVEARNNISNIIRRLKDAGEIFFYKETSSDLVY